jgi:hypothetical protein
MEPAPQKRRIFGVIASEEGIWLVDSCFVRQIMTSRKTSVSVRSVIGKCSVVRASESTKIVFFSKNQDFAPPGVISMVLVGPGPAISDK